MSESSATAVARIAPLSDDDLYRELADLVVDGASGFDDDRRRRLGQAWFDAQLDTLRSRLCGQEALRPMDANPTSEETLAATVADLLAGLHDLPTIATLSLLAVRYGLARLCS